MVQRLCWEANRQDCALTQEDLARLLYCGITSICRIIAEYRKANVFIPTRGNYCDIGPGTSHKAQAVQRYLRGASVTEISRVMAHAPQSIERYLDTFAVVASATENEGYTPRRISQLMRLSRKLVTEYVQLYTEAQLDPDSQHRLAQIALRARTLQKRAKKNGRPQ